MSQDVAGATVAGELKTTATGRVVHLGSDAEQRWMGSRHPSSSTPPARPGLPDGAGLGVHGGRTCAGTGRRRPSELGQAFLDWDKESWVDARIDLSAYGADLEDVRTAAKAPRCLAFEQGQTAFSAMLEAFVQAHRL